MLIGVIADTHGLVRPEALAALRGADLILHAGDVGSPDVLDALARVAPVRAVRGNNDRGAWADSLPETDLIEVADVRIFLLHDLRTLTAAARAVDAVVAGHSHRPSSVVRDGVLYFNPGSAGPRRFRLPISVGRLRVRRCEIHAELVEVRA